MNIKRVETFVCEFTGLESTHLIDILTEVKDQYTNNNKFNLSDPQLSTLDKILSGYSKLNRSFNGD